MSKVTFTDKSQIGSYDAALFNAQDANEIKNSINALYDNPNLQGILEFEEMSIVHTNGIADFYAGVGSAISSSIGAGTDGANPKNLILTPDLPYWMSLNIPASGVNMSVYSNVIETDLSGSGSNNWVVVYLKQAYKNTLTGATSGQRQTLNMASSGIILDDFTTGGQAPVSTFHSPPIINDTGTLYGTVEADVIDLPAEAFRIGTGGTYSRYFFTFGIQIPASAISKTYKFKIFLSYQ